MTEEQKMATSYGEIKDKVLKLQLKVLVNFFECAMYQAFGEEWKEKTMLYVRERVLRNVHSMNYKSLNDAYDKKHDFAITDLDIIAIAALIVYDFRDVCCRYRNLDDEKLRKLVSGIRSSRNAMAHQVSDDLKAAREGLEQLRAFVAFLEENGWEYEANKSFKEYLRKDGRAIDASRTFVTDVKNELLDCEIEVEKQKKQ